MRHDEHDPLSSLHQRVLARGVSGGDENDPQGTPPAEGTPPAPAEGTPPAEGEGTPPAEGTAPAEGTPPAEGEAESTSASIDVPDLPGDLTAEDEQGLRDLDVALDALHGEHRPRATSQADLDALRTIRERQTAIRTEIQRRRDEDARLQAELEALDGEALPDLPAPVPALASAGAVIAARGSQPAAAQAPPPPAPDRPRAVLQAAAGGTVQAGTPLDMANFGRGIEAASRGSAGDHYVASVGAFEYDTEHFPIDEMLHRDNSAHRNRALMGEAVEQWRARRRGEAGDPHLAAICGPFDIIREIPDAFSSSTPVADMFPSRPAGRLGFQFAHSVPIEAVVSAVTVWDSTDQDGVDEEDASTWKPCVEVSCPAPGDVEAEAIPGCLIFDNTTEMSNPETVTNFTNALRAQRARVKDGRLLQIIDANSSAYNADDVQESYGAVATIIEVANTLIGQAVWAQRLEDPDYDLIVDGPTIRLARIDLANRGYGVPEVSDVVQHIVSQVDGLSNVVVSLDEALGGAQPGLPLVGLNPAGDAADTLPTLNGIRRLRLIAPEAGLYGETGEQNAGVSRDTRMLRMNKAQYFIEEYVMLAKHGWQPWLFADTYLCADGARAGLLEPHRCAIS